MAAVGAIGPVFASFGLMMIRKLTRGGYRSLVWAALFVGLGQASLGQDYECAAPGVAPPATLVSGGATLFQNVRIFDGKTTALSTPSNVLVRGNTIDASRRARSPSTRRRPSLRQTGGC